jgi:hypothetical protein
MYVQPSRYILGPMSWRHCVYAYQLTMCDYRTFVTTQHFPSAMFVPLPEDIKDFTLQSPISSSAKYDLTGAIALLATES